MQYRFLELREGDDAIGVQTPVTEQDQHGAFMSEKQVQQHTNMLHTHKDFFNTKTFQHDF